MEVLPIFSSHHSIGSSILTLEPPPKPEDFDETQPSSVIDICVKNKVKDLFLAETNMSGFVSAYKNCKANDINFHFGLKIVLCNNMKDKSQDSLASDSKVIIWLKNTDGYKKIVNMYSKAATEGFYYRPRLDCALLRSLWDDKSLSLTVPYYYSFLHRNLLHSGNCLPDFSFTKPVFLQDINDLPFNYLLDDCIKDWCEQYSGCRIMKAKSIYYNQESDFLYYLAYKCMQERTTLNMPNFDHLGSNQFSFESWRKLNGL